MYMDGQLLLCKVDGNQFFTLLPGKNIISDLIWLLLTIFVLVPFNLSVIVQSYYLKSSYFCLC